MDLIAVAATDGTTPGCTEAFTVITEYYPQLPQAEGPGERVLDVQGKWTCARQTDSAGGSQGAVVCGVPTSSLQVETRPSAGSGKTPVRQSAAEGRQGAQRGRPVPRRIGHHRRPGLRQRAVRPGPAAPAAEGRRLDPRADQRERRRPDRRGPGDLPPLIRGNRRPAAGNSPGCRSSARPRRPRRLVRPPGRTRRL